MGTPTPEQQMPGGRDTKPRQPSSSFPTATQ
jgi:hypothetical protein